MLMRAETPHPCAVLMSRGPGKIQRAVHKLLEFAWTAEPWPVHMSAIGSRV